jgi:hypothetical protein
LRWSTTLQEEPCYLGKPDIGADYGTVAALIWRAWHFRDVAAHSVLSPFVTEEGNEVGVRRGRKGGAVINEAQTKYTCAGQGSPKDSWSVLNMMAALLAGMTAWASTNTE